MLNKATLIGRVGKDPENFSTQNGSSLAKFSLATMEKWKDSHGEKQEKTSWHNILAWRKHADLIMEYVKKGDQLYIEGSIDYQVYEKDGVKKYSTSIVMNKVIFLGGGKNRTSSENSKAQSPSPPAPKDDSQKDQFIEDDIPF